MQEKTFLQNILSSEVEESAATSQRDDSEAENFSELFEANRGTTFKAVRLFANGLFPCLWCLSECSTD